MTEPLLIGSKITEPLLIRVQRRATLIIEPLLITAGAVGNSSGLLNKQVPPSTGLLCLAPGASKVFKSLEAEEVDLMINICHHWIFVFDHELLRLRTCSKLTCCLFSQRTSEVNTSLYFGRWICKESYLFFISTNRIKKVCSATLEAFAWSLVEDTGQQLWLLVTNVPDDLYIYARLLWSKARGFYSPFCYRRKTKKKKS